MKFFLSVSNFSIYNTILYFYTIFIILFIIDLVEFYFLVKKSVKFQLKKNQNRVKWKTLVFTVNKKCSAVVINKQKC